MFDYERLIAPIDGDSPCGPDLRDVPEFRDIEDAPGDFANQKSAELLGVVEQCDALLERTKDHTPAIVALQAAVRIGDWGLATAALMLIKGFAEEYWEDFHPGPADEMVIARVNELSALARPAAMTLPLQRAALAALPPPSSLGFTGGMIAAACAPVEAWSSNDESALANQVENGQITATVARNVKPTRDGARMLRSIMRVLSPDARAADAAAGVDAETIELAPDALEALAQSLRQQIADARDAFAAMADVLYDIGAIYDRNAGESASFGPVLSTLGAIVGDVDRFLLLFPKGGDYAEPAAADGGEPAADGAAAGGGAAGSRSFVSSVPRSRGDVIQAIDAIGRYYIEQEPTSPVPLMLARLRTWVTMDFMELLQEIVPTAVDDASVLLAVRPKEAEEEY